MDRQSADSPAPSALGGALGTFPKLLLDHAARRGDTPANREKDYGIWQSWSWRDVAAEVRALANGLAAMGFRRGDKLTIIASCHGAGFSPRVGQEAPRILSTLSLVAAGLGVSLVPASLQHLRMDGVVFRRLAGEPQPKAPFNLACRRDEVSAVVRRFVALVRQTAGERRPAG